MRELAHLFPGSTGVCVMATTRLLNGPDDDRSADAGGTGADRG
ncbi:hypothetical protein MOTT12_01754 [Mycobacterium intracellulare subsp. yongonense]|nr:hypothetical protein MOTT12_01754 [Mycobacterium intracellulare subsp. yongonense]ARR82550.1 hypothetical protein MOTT27_01729 [Mycobacterium intracellulare subsp. yongonense]